ncbi:MAG: aromatic ring-hydroxylating dioxygenase subunit alpha [Sphingobium sp.]|uniref:aromatic ring-hydroxylating oxygenase subunit alpha n=1 Tax=Sphingobium sp. TaxID=1912891 RepID=UPI002E21D2EA
MSVETFMSRHIADYDPPVRGDPITGERYYSRRWADAEWDKVWTKVWHVGGMAADLIDTGDYLTHNLGRESIVMLKQADGSVRAFYNACLHRGYRLAWTEVGGAPQLVCGYHGWRYDPDGTLAQVQDPEDFPGGNPCGKHRLTEIGCEVWGGFVWFNMDRDAPPLRDWLGAAVHDRLAQWQMEKMTRVYAVTSDVPCNWKIVRDNFNESYHLPTLHPEIKTVINDQLADCDFAIFAETGHNMMRMPGLQPSARYPTHQVLDLPLAQALEYWELDPTAYEGNAMAARAAIAAQKRKLGAQKGYAHYDGMGDTEIVDYFHFTLWPNITFTMWPDGVQLLRSEPHPTDPERCIFDHWFMAHPIGDTGVVIGPNGPTPLEPVDREHIVFGEKSLGVVADQDLSVATGQQLGLHSRGFRGGILSNQEKRVQFFHEKLNDVCGIHD